MESSFLELRCKEVINVADGKRLGRIVDIVFDLPSGKIKGLVVPMPNCGFSLFRQQQHIFIPFNQICKIGADIILVEMYSDDISANTYILSEPKKKNNKN